MRQFHNFNSAGLSFRVILLVGWASIVALLRLVNLGFVDLQAWDEAAHNIRSYSVHVFGDWLDQTSHALGGLTTSAFPPLSIWLTTLAYNLFGASEWTTRLTSALCGLASVLVIGMIVQRTANIRAAVFSSLLLGTNLFFTFYSRQGQLDLPYIFFMTLSVWGWFLHTDNSSSRSGLAIIALATFGALMSKILVGLYVPILLVTLHALDPTHRRQLKSFLPLCGALALGCVLALPWHLYMLAQHGRAFLDAYVLFHIVGRAIMPMDAHDPSLGWLFFFNQIPVQFPEAGFGIGLVSLWIGSRLDHDERLSRLIKVALVWTVLVLVPITLMATKIVHYAIPLAIPIAMLGGIALDRIATASLSRRHLVLLLLPYVIFVAWDGLGPLRTFLKRAIFSPSEIIGGMDAQATSLILACIGASLVVMLIIRRLSWERILPLLRTYPYAVLLVLSWTLAYEVIVHDRTQYDYGVRTIAGLLREQKSEHIMYLGVDLHPALRLYLHGWDRWNEHTLLSEYVPTAASTIARPTPHVELPIGEKQGFLVIERRAVQRGYYLREDSIARGLPVLFDNSHYKVYRLWKPEMSSVKE